MADKETERRNLVLAQSSKHVSTLWDNYITNTRQKREKFVQWYKQYRGIPTRKNYEGLANVFVNETLEACEAIVAQIFHSIYAEPKRVYLKGREETDEDQAQILEKMMDLSLDQISDKTKVLRSIRQMVKYGTTVAKVPWAYKSKDIITNVKGDGDVVLLGQKMKKIVKDNPDLQYVDLLDVALDPNKACIEDMDWVIIRKKVNLDYLKERERNGVYGNIGRVRNGSYSSSKNLQKTYSSADFEKQSQMWSTGVNYSELDYNPHEILEYWGLSPRWWIEDDLSVNSPHANELVETVIEVCNQKTTVRLEENPYWHKEKPILLAQFIQVDNEAFGIGVCEIAEYLQQELNDKRNQLLDHATEQIAPPLIRHRGSNIRKEQIKLSPFAIIDSDIAGSQALQPMQLGGNPSEIVAMDSIVKQDIRNQTGATNPVQGVAFSKETTAYETSVLERRGASRINLTTIDFAEKFLKPFYKLVYKLLQQYMTTEKAIKIVGKQGVKWVKVSQQDLYLDSDFEPKIPTDVANRTLMINQMIQFITAVAKYYPQTNAYRLVRKIYRLFGFDDEEEVIPSPDIEQGQNDINMDEEISVLSQGQKINVPFYDNHFKRYTFLVQFLEQNRNNLSPEGIAAFEDKIRQHLAYLERLEQAVPSASAPTPTPMGAAPINRGQIPNPDFQDNEIAPISQMQRDLSRV